MQTMMQLHILDARGTLQADTAWITATVTQVHAQSSGRLDLGALDIVVQANSRVIPEKGHVGHAVQPGLIYLTVDPDNPAFRTNADASFERMVAHELHHACRWDGPGYGSSLGAALVSEGLAGHFAQEMFGGSPEPWESLPREDIAAFVPLARQHWDDDGYDHMAWFFGTGDMPRWLGYSMGFNLVGAYLARHPEQTAANLAHAEAALFSAHL